MFFNNFTRLKAVAATALVVLAGAAAAQDDKPNILVIWGDDVGQSNISAYTMGLMGYRTPNIDRIAAGGFSRRRIRALSRVGCCCGGRSVDVGLPDIAHRAAAFAALRARPTTG